MIIPIIIILAFTLGLLTGAFLKANINVNINHKRSEPAPVDNVDKPVEYNPSYGDPDVKAYFDKQFGGDN
jgi:hypothetical protein